ncbi:MAG: GNAT family N-acetyltransferase [Phycisphaeraceae bacterium]|nr:GNAT family N-acetyltransferase [Phycisphaeraceae bacterium]
MTAADARPSEQAWIRPVTLAGRHVRLEPLTPAHAHDLHAGTPLDTFRYFTFGPEYHTEAAMRAFIERLIADPGRLHFAVIDLASSRAVGSTSFYDIRPAHRGAEIGFTWYAECSRGTAVNPESKRLLLSHAFDTLSAERIAFRTDARNLRSRAALAKLGATQEGIFRRHLIMPDGAWRDSVYFSILRDEWPAVRDALDARLARSTEASP